MDNGGNHNKLAKLLRYKYSRTKVLNDYVPLSQYVDEMKKFQGEIYFFSGSYIADMEGSHFMEKFQDKDVEVLYFNYPVDYYMSNKLREFGGKNFTSISSEVTKFKDEDKYMGKRMDRNYSNNYRPLTKWLNKMCGRYISKVYIILIHKNVPVSSFLDAESSVDVLHNQCEGLNFPT